MPFKNNYIIFIYRNISLCTKLCHGNNSRKLKVVSDISTSKKQKSVDTKAEKNRSNWEKEIANETSLIGRTCSDNVYFTNEYEKKLYSLKDAIYNHKDCLLDKSMLDSPESVLNANFNLNMKTKKTTKFIQKFHGIVVPKYKLHFVAQPKVLAFCQTEEDTDIALVNGAYLAGNETLIKKLRTGEICYEEFDQVVCHVDSLPLLAKLKPVLKEKFPVKGTPRVGNNIGELVNKYVTGYEFESKKVEGIPEESHLTVPLGEISWSVEHLVENFRIFLKDIIMNSSKQIQGNLINKISLTCRPSEEVFYLEFSKELEECNVEKKISSDF